MTGPNAGLRNVQVSLVDRGLAPIGLSAPSPSLGADPRAQAEGVSLECGAGKAKWTVQMGNRVWLLPASPR